VAKAKQDIRDSRPRSPCFRLDNSKYPTTDQGLKALSLQPTDPTIHHWRPGATSSASAKIHGAMSYQYVYPGTHGREYDLFSFGADGQPGGDGINADVGNWNDDQQQQQQ